MRIRSGPKMDPGGTPERTSESEELDLLTTTVCFLHVR